MTTRVTLIGDNAVNSGSIFNGTVNSEDLNRTAGQQAVTTDTIRDGAVTATKLQSSASNDAQRAVGTNHIQDKAVVAAKLGSDVEAYLSFPLGGIVMWSGTTQQIPPGWYLCDGGTYGGLKTPDLRNKFIVGSAGNGTGNATVPSTGPTFDTAGNISRNYTTHDYGGFVAHKLSYDEMPSHQHAYAFAQGSGGGMGNNYESTGISVVINRGNLTELEQSGGPDGQRLAAFTANTGPAGTNYAHENRPPYYALAYIMKCEFRAGSVATITTTTPTLQELRLNGPLYDQEMDGGAQKGNAGDVLTSLGAANGVRWESPVPVGAVFHFASSTAPTGYLIANGDLVPNGVGTVQGKTANFSALYAALGTTYGAAGKLPDLRGEFIRGWDANRGIDASTGGGIGPILSRVFGSFQDHAFGSHTHDLGYTSGTAVLGSGIIRGIPSLFSTTKGYTGAMSTEGGTETRPRNVALLPCIKY